MFCQLSDFTENIIVNSWEFFFIFELSKISSVIYWSFQLLQIPWYQGWSLSSLLVLKCTIQTSKLNVEIWNGEPVSGWLIELHPIVEESWSSGRVSNHRSKGRGFESQQRRDWTSYLSQTYQKGTSTGRFVHPGSSHREGLS